MTESMWSRHHSVETKERKESSRSISHLECISSNLASLFIYLFVYLLMYFVWGAIYTMIHMWRSEDNLQVLSFGRVGLRLNSDGQAKWKVYLPTKPSCQPFIIILLLYFICLFVCVRVCVCVYKLKSILSFQPWGSWGLNSNCQTWWQVLLPIEPCPWPHSNFLLLSFTS